MILNKRLLSLVVQARQKAGFEPQIFRLSIMIGYVGRRDPLPNELYSKIN